VNRGSQSEHGPPEAVWAADVSQPASAVDEADVAVLRDEIHGTLLYLLRAGVLIGLIADVLFGIADIFFEPRHDLRIALVRIAILGTCGGLWVATYRQWAMRRAVPLALLGVALGCVLIVGPTAMHDDLANPMVLTLAFAAAISLAAPWGVGGQLAAILVTSLTTVVTIALVTGELRLGLAEYPPVTAAIVFGASLFGAAVCRRSNLLSVERGIGLRRSLRTLAVKEAQIRNQLVQLDTLYRSAPIGLSLVDRELRYLRINDTLADMRGLPADAHIGRTLREVLPTLADTLEPIYRRVLATGEPVLGFEISGSTGKSPGDTRHWRCDYWPLQAAGGRVDAVSCVVQDVTEPRRAQEAAVQLNADLERRVSERTVQLEATNARLELESAVRQQAAEALRRSQEQLRNIIDNTTAVIYLKDLNGRYLLINRQYEALFHVSRERIVGKTDYDVFPRDAADMFSRNDREVLTAGHALTFEETVPQDDGAHTYVSIKFPLRDTAGIPYAACGISTDITPRKRMEAQLEESRAQLIAVVENTTDAIWSVDLKYRMIVANPVVARWFREAFGRDLRSADPFEQRAPESENLRWRPLYDRAFAGERLAFEREFSTDGTVRSYLISMTPIVTGDHVSGATVFAKDITDLRRAEARAREHQAELSHVLRLHTIGELAASLAHEINQPLGAILNYARGCRNRILSGDTQLDAFLPVLEDIATQALRSSEIIRRLRLMVEKRTPTRDTVDINAVVTEAVRVMSPELRHQGVTLNLELAPDLPAVEIDSIQIEQVIVNLLLNSLEAMQASTAQTRHVTVRTEAVDTHSVQTLVRDTGGGVPPAMHERMFEPFFSGKPSGLGMGLAISRSIVEGHGGRIWAANHPDCGTQVYVVLPSVTAPS